VTLRCSSIPLLGLLFEYRAFQRLNWGLSLGAAPPASRPSLLWRGFLNISLKPSLSNVTHDLPKPQNCLVGNGQFGGIVVWDKGGELWGGGDGGEGDFPVPLDIYHPSKEMDECDYSPDPLNWDYDEVEDPALALLDAIEEDFLWEAKDAQAKYKGTRELLNLKSLVSDGDVNTSNW
jgi:hypothetical protein